MLPVAIEPTSRYRRRSVPFATATLISLNVISWVLLQGLGLGQPMLDSICQFGLIPAALTGQLAPGQVIELGPGVHCVSGGSQPLALLSSMFMHGSWLHILGNLWFLWLFGPWVEDRMGPGRFLSFYLICGLLAGLAHVASDTGSAIPMVGASGAIGGVMGAYALLFPGSRIRLLIFLGFYITTVSVPALLMLGYWFLLQLLGITLDAGGGVAFWAHIGGFLAGAALFGVFLRRRR
jgi:membrane associated rhomboid family serine protease